MNPISRLFRNVLNANFTSAPRKASTRNPNRVRLQLETLEVRELLTADWFSTYIPNASVASLVRNDWNSHGSVNRNDMLAVYSQVGRDGRVDSSELSSLKFLANYGNLLNMPAPVQGLSSEVVSTTNSANLRYQGTASGYLGVNSSSTQLQNLVNEWFLGRDRPTLASGTYGTYQAVSGSLFGAGGPKYTDIKQGALGDCTYLASLAATAARTNLVSSMFTANGDNTWTVRMYRNGSPVYVTVDHALPNAGGLYAHPNSGVFWASLAEKAVAQINEQGWLGTLQPGVNSYNAISSGNYNTANAAIGLFSGRGASAYTIAANGTDITSAMASGKIVVALTGNTTGHANIINNHAYAVVGYNPSASLPFTVYNPWGLAGGNSGGKFIWGQFNANGSAMKAYFWADCRTNSAPGATPGVTAVTQAVSSQEFVVSTPTSFSFQMQVAVAQNVSVQTPFVAGAGLAIADDIQAMTMASRSQNAQVSQEALDALWCTGNLSELADTLAV